MNSYGSNFAYNCLTRVISWINPTSVGCAVALAGLAFLYSQRERISEMVQKLFSGFSRPQARPPAPLVAAGPKAPMPPAAAPTVLPTASGDIELSVERVPAHENPAKHIVSVAVAAGAANLAATTNGVGHLILVVDNSGSMGGTRIESVKRGIDSLCRDPENKNLQLTIITYDTGAHIWCRRATVNDVLPNINSWIKGDGAATNFCAAMDKLDEVVEQIRDGNQIPTSAIFLTDGDESSGNVTLANRGLAQSHKLWKERQIRVVVAGIQEHKAEILNKIKGDLPGAYYYISGNNVVKDSPGYKMGERTFAQIVDEVSKLIRETLLAGAKLSFNVPCREIGGGEFDADVGSVSRQDSYLLEVDAKAPPVTASLTGTSLADKKMIVLQGHQKLSQNPSVVWSALLRETQSIYIQVVQDYSQSKGNAHQCITKIEAILGKVSRYKGAGKPEELAEIERVLTGHRTSMQRGAALVGDALAQAYAAGAYSKASGSAPAGNAQVENIVMAPAGFSRVANNLVITPIQQAFYDAQSLAIPEANADKGGIVINARDLFIKVGHNQIPVTLPMGYHCLGGIDKGEVFSFVLPKETEHAQVLGQFGPNTNIAKFEAENKVKFILPCERDAKVNVDGATKKTMGISESENAYFQWVSPSAATFKPEAGSPYYFDDATPADQRQKITQRLLDKMGESVKAQADYQGVKLSSMEYFALTVGFFIYHEGDYQVVTRDGKKMNVRWNRHEKRYQAWDAEQQEFIPGGKTFGPNSIEAKSMMRKLAQVRVLDPTSTFGGQFFPFDSLTQIPYLTPEERKKFGINLSIQDQLEAWHRGADDPLFGVTIPAFKALGISHARWLNPTEKHYGKLIEDIKRTLYMTAKTKEEKQKYARTLWGQFGVYVYYSEKNPKDAYIIAMITGEQALSSLKGKYQIMVEDVGQKQVIELEQSTCLVCGENPPQMKLSCGETPYCQTCYNDLYSKENLLEIKCENPLQPCNTNIKITQQQREDVSKKVACPCCQWPNTIKLHTCGSCKKSVDLQKTKLEPLGVAKIAEKLQGIPQFTFHLAKIDLNYDLEDDWVIEFLKDPTYASDKYPVPQTVRDKLKLPANVTTWAFQSPVIGKDLETSLGVSDLFRLGLQHLKGKKEFEVMEALYKTGANVFFDKEGNPVAAYAYLIAPGPDTVQLDFKTNANPNGQYVDDFKRAYQAGKKTHITVKALHFLAQWFRFNGQGFTYMLPGENLKKAGFFTAEI